MNTIEFRKLLAFMYNVCLTQHDCLELNQAQCDSDSDSDSNSDTSTLR